MFHVLILGGNKGINLYFLSDNSIKAVFCSTEFDIKELTNFDAAVVVCGNLSDSAVRKCSGAETDGRGRSERESFSLKNVKHGK